MGIFDLFRTKSSEEMARDEMRRAVVALFPGGQAEMHAVGEALSKMLAGRITPKNAGIVIAQARHMAKTSTDKSREKMVDYISLKLGESATRAEASEAYDRFVAIPR